MTRKIYYAHSLPGQPPEKWETMQQHESAVAKRCAMFLKRIHPSLDPWGNLLGRWHDLGKYSSEFQTYLFTANQILDQLNDVHTAEATGKVDHSTAAAQFAEETFGNIGRLLSYCFAGHHAGLPDWDDGIGQSGLLHRLQKKIPPWKTNAAADVLSFIFPGRPNFQTLEKNEHDIAAFRVAFWIRMIFSALVDADFLATEAFMSPDRLKDRTRRIEPISELANCLEQSIERIQMQSQDTDVNRIRKSVSEVCLTRSQLPPGAFSLCVPTGGGKTLASLRFALNHAIKNNLDRVIVAVPFTSIIEQNASVYRELFSELGPDVVLEHHSNLDPATETTTNRLQAENWDSPLVVTTNVQLFESLFACRTSQCRKLHRIARSVIVLDEAQTLPIELLKPTLMALRELLETFDCSIVLCSATQPALDYRDDFRIGLKNITPIIDDASSLHHSLRRVQVEVAGPIDNEELARRLNVLPQVLCIVNSRPHAAAVFERLDNRDQGCFHLSTRMCAAHRKEILTTIRLRLKNKQNCRVISTQLIEAGVDVDFPCVYRASCGLDSLAQAAGRCNREGLKKIGHVIYFDAESPPPPGFLRQSAGSAKELLDEFAADLLAPSAIEKYFQLHYWKKKSSWDNFQVLDAIGNQPSKIQFNFRQVAERYQFIRDATETILVGWNDIGKKLLRDLEDPHHFIDRNTWRKLQRYTVQLRHQEFAQLLSVAAVENRHERWVLVHAHLYDKNLGLCLSKADGVLPIEDTII